MATTVEATTMPSDEQVREALRTIREGWWDYEASSTRGNVDPWASALVVLGSAFPAEDGPADTTIRAWLRGESIPRRPAWRERVVERGAAVARAVRERTAAWEQSLS